jgi:hypothetical protein
MRRQIVSASEAADVRQRSGFQGMSNEAIELISNPMSSDTTSADDYKDKLLKHIPAEAVAAYITLDGIVRSAAQGNSLKVWLWVAFLLGLIGTPLYLWRLQNVTSRMQLSVSTVSFAVWVFALGGIFAQYSWYHSWFASVVLVGYTFLIPTVLGRS